MSDYQLVSLTDEEIRDLISTLEIRVQDERRMFFAATDYATRKNCRDAADRMMALARRLRLQIGVNA
jgi:hypothetical protein